jgi:L-aminopeptidase/D-esterase-like protein
MGAMIGHDPEGALGLVYGVSVGHATDAAGKSGCTVVCLDGGEGRGAVAGVEVRGGAPGTLETDLLRPENLVARADAFLVTGGSAFGLAAASGVMAVLEERGRGFATAAGRVPIVPGAVVFDLGSGGQRPDADTGARAARSASSGDRSRGRVGAGAGCLVGKALGPDRASPGGLGQASARLREGGPRVGALAVVNAFGEVRDRGGTILAGARGPDGKWVETLDALASGGEVPWRRESTTIVVVATDAPLGKIEVSWVARMAQSGLARAITPAWTSVDGDVVFAAATGLGARAGADAIGALAAVVVERAIRDAVRAVSA